MENKDLFIVTARLRAREGKEAELRGHLEDLIKACAHHEGLLFYSVQQKADDPARFMFYEHFSSKEAFEAHGASPELEKARPGFADLVDGETELEFWDMGDYTGAVQLR